MGAVAMLTEPIGNGVRELHARRFYDGSMDTPRLYAAAKCEVGTRRFYYGFIDK